MLRRANIIRNLVYGLLAVVVLTSTVYAAGTHVFGYRGDTSIKSCETTCLSHTQTNTLQNVLEKENDEDKEPIPPAYLITGQKINLGYFGVTFYILLFLILYERKYLRLQQLRF